MISRLAEELLPRLSSGDNRSAGNGLRAQRSQLASVLNIAISSALSKTKRMPQRRADRNLPFRYPLCHVSRLTHSARADTCFGRAKRLRRPKDVAVIHAARGQMGN